MPGYRKTPEEVKRIEELLEPTRFVVDEFSIDFKTTWG